MGISELYSIFLRHPVVTTDSRECPEGSIFFALKGESFNGNMFAATALDKGCAYAVVDEVEHVVQGDSRFVLVDNCLATFQQLALYHRRTLSTKIIGITGTNGKTTTKELVSAVLSERYNVLYTLGNFNNDIGVPKTLLRLTKEHEIAVIEMGASHQGDIKKLVDIVEPDCGIITNVGRAHLQGFGSFEGVVRTKGELYDYLRAKQGAVVFIDAENTHLMGISHGLNLVKYGCVESPDMYVTGSVISCAPFLKFQFKTSKGEWNEVGTQMIGSYNIYNMLAAAAIGLHEGVSQEQVSHALANYVPSNNRSQLEQTTHNQLIMDAYNANPTSMNAAITNFRDMQVSHKMVILGDMRELGEVSEEEHQKIVNLLSICGFDNVWLVGEEFGKTKTNFRKFLNANEVKAEITHKQPQGYYILIKGSNGIRLATLSEVL